MTPAAAIRPGRFRAWQVAVVLVLAALAGAAILLQIRGWSAVEGESGSACASGSAVCPRGVVPVLVISFVVGLATIPFVIAAVVRRPKVNAVAAAVGLAAGVFAAQALSGGLHAAGLRVDWTAPYDAAGSPATEGVWTAGSSLIRVRADQVVSYQAATGRQQWTLAVPGGDVACAVSAGTSSATVGLIGYGTAGGACDQLLAVDLGTGQQLWSKRVPASWKGDQGTGFVAVGGDTAVAVTAGAVLGYDQRTGAPRWTALTPPGCSDQTLAGAQQSVVVLAACGRTFDVIDLDPASGKQLWRTPVPGQAPGYHFAILSADPAVVADVSPGQPEQVLAFGATGHLTSTIPVGDLDTNYYQGFGPQVAVSGGLLIGVTRSRWRPRRRGRVPPVRRRPSVAALDARRRAEPATGRRPAARHRPVPPVPGARRDLAPQRLAAPHRLHPRKHRQPQRRQRVPSRRPLRGGQPERPRPRPAGRRRRLTRGGAATPIGEPPVAGEPCGRRDDDPGLMTENVGTGALPSPLSHFVAQLDEVRAGGVPDMDAIGRLLVQLAADDEFFAPLIAGMPPESMGVHWLVKPERGPRLVLVHRPEGVMAYTHSHGCWVGDRPRPGSGDSPALECAQS